MPLMDIFNNDAFGVISLSTTLNELPHIPGRIGELRLFQEEGITTTSMLIEAKGTTVNIVPASTRGSPGTPVVGDKARLIPIATTHLAQSATILADEIQNVRAFGTESEVQTVQGVVTPRIAKMARNLDATIEYQRIGAIKGQVLDSDGSSVLLDLFTTLGVTQQTKAMVLGTPSTKVRQKVLEAKRLMEAELGGVMYTAIRNLCSPAFFDALTTHALVEAAFDRFQNGEFLRMDARGGFYYAGCFWEEYRGKIGSIDFIADGDAYMIPEGVPDMFLTNYAPADYVETANTRGLPYYAKQEALRMGKGIELEVQSNPISVCTRPRAIIKLGAA